jgi:ABC-2 type transport system permease protein
MRAVSVIFRRELNEYVHSLLGYVVAAAVLLVGGLLFYAQALGPAAGERLSGEVLARFFEWEIVLGKFASALAFLGGITLISVYMPLLIMVNGKISVGQVAVGYAGLLLLGAACLAIGVFATALARHQLLAVVVASALTGAMFLFWPLSLVVDPPLSRVFAGLAIHARHFQGFQVGVLHLRDVVYYLAVTYFFLVLATKTLEAKRWE